MMGKNDHICQRCCFFEACTRMGRTDSLACIYGSRDQNDIDPGKDKGEKDEKA